MQYPFRPHEHLALLGLVASPLQMVWIYAHLRNNVAQARDLAPAPSPLEWLRAYQRELLRQTQDLFHQAEQLPQVLQLHDSDGSALAIHCPVACTVAQLLDAQRICLG